MKTRSLSIFLIMFSIAAFLLGITPVQAEYVSAIGTATSTPTRKPTIKSAIFNLGKANKVPPADILNQIAFASRGGGGDICIANTYPSPAIGRTSDRTAELMVYSYLGVCGWENNEKVIGTVKYPTGTTKNIQVERDKSNGHNVGIIKFRPTIDDPIGKYTITMTGGSKSLQFVVNYVNPKEPRVYTVGSKNILLYGFKPLENVELYFYSGTNGSFKGWQDYNIGMDGRLGIETSMSLGKGDFFVAIGEKTGEVHMLFDGFYGGTSDWVVESTIVNKTKVICPGGLPSRVKKGGQAQAAYTDGSNLRIRVNAGFNEGYDHKVPEGTKMKIIGGPKCVDNSTWWQVEITGNIKGWVAEYWNGKEYLIEPLP